MYWLGMKSVVTERSHALYGSPGFSVKYGVPEAAVAPLIGGSNTRYRPGLLILPPPRVSAYLSRSNQTRLYAMNPRKLCFGPDLPSPKQLTPPPVSQPMSPVKVAAALLMNEAGRS